MINSLNTDGGCDMRKSKTLLCVLIFLTVACLTVSAVAETKATIKGGRLFMRSGPGFEFDIVAVYNTGTRVTVLDSSNPLWYSCKGPDGHTGFMYAQYLNISNPQSSGTLADGDTVYVTSSNGLSVNLRTGPGTNYAAFGSYSVGTQAVVHSAGVNWSYITIGGKSGFMMTKYLTKKQPSTGSKTAYITSKNGLNVQLRSGPGTGYKVLAAFPVGQKVTVYQWGNTWSTISVANLTGYMMSKFLTTKEPVPVDPPAGASMVYSPNGLKVNLRSGPGTNWAIIDSIAPGTPVTILTEDTIWNQVKVGNLVGYMMKSYIRTR